MEQSGGFYKRNLIAPLLCKFIRAYRDLRVELADYFPNGIKKPNEDVDVFFKIRAPQE